MFCQVQKRQSNKTVCLSSANKEMLDWCLFLPVVSVSSVDCRKHQWKMTWGDIHSMWNTFSHMPETNPYKVCNVLCFWSAACAIELLNNVAGRPRRLLKLNKLTEHITFRPSSRITWNQNASTPRSFTSGPSSQTFPGTDIIAQVYSGTDVCAPPTTPLSGHGR